MDKQTDPFYTSGPWRAIREQALIRDHYICQKCLKKWEMGKILKPHDATMVHHIIPRSERPDLELCLENLISLCDSCHNEEHPERGFKPQRRETAQYRRTVTITNERDLDHG